MAQVFGVVEKSYEQNGQQHTVFSIPAFSKTGAKRRAKINARIKGINSFSVGSISTIGSGSVPGATVYEVDIVSPA